METLIRKILREETETINFNDVYKSLWKPMLYKVCLKYTDDIDQAKEYCQKGFIKVYQNLHKYNQRGSIEGWVRTVITRTILDDLDVQKNYTKKLSTPKYREHFDTINQEYDDEQNEQNIKDILEVIPKLSKAYRKVVEMFYFDKMSHEEIAKELGINVGTSKSNLFKAKERIRQLITKKNEE